MTKHISREERVASDTVLQKAELSLIRLADSTLTMSLAGEWKLGRQLPQAEGLKSRIESTGTVSRITFDTKAMTGWDSGLITFLISIVEIGSEMHVPVEKDGLPAGVQRILALASAVPERKGVRREAAKTSFVDRVGQSSIAFCISKVSVPSPPRQCRTPGTKYSLKEPSILATPPDFAATLS